MPPRGLFLNYPLGFETGKPFDKKNQSEVVESALAKFESFEQPGIKTIEYEWQTGWKMTLERARMEGEDSRSTRDTTPKYQNEEDKRLAENKANN